MTTIPTPPTERAVDRFKGFVESNKLKLSVFVALGAIGVMSYFGEDSGMNKEAGILEPALNSGAHLDVGYTAGVAVAVFAALKKTSEFIQKRYYLIGGAAVLFADGIAEIARTYTATDFEYNPLAPLPHFLESAKDLGAAALGYGIYRIVESEKVQGLIGQNTSNPS